MTCPPLSTCWTFLFAAAWLLLAFVAPARQLPPEGTPIGEVEFRGLNGVQRERVLAAMTLKPGSIFSAEALRRDMQAVADLGFFDPLSLRADAEPISGEGQAVRLLIFVRENPVIRDIRFIGNVKYSAKRLTQELDYKAGDIAPAGIRGATSRNLKSFYSGGGFKSTEVRVDLQPAPSPDGEDAPALDADTTGTATIDGEPATGAVDVVITIDEGEKILIDDLYITGNDHFPAWLIKTWVTNSGSWLIFKNYYDAEAFEEDLRLIESKHRDAGYLDAVARAGEFRYDETRARVSPEIVIEEGPRYTVADYQLNGVALFNEDEVRGIFDPLVDRRFDGKDFRDAMDKLRILYGNQGYVDVDVDGRFEKDPAAAEVVLILNITENLPVTVGQVIIERERYDIPPGDRNFIQKFLDWTSPGVKDETILNEVRLQPGTTWRTKDEEHTEQRLESMGFFETAEVERVPTSDAQVDDAVVRVKEDPAAGFIGATVGVGELAGPYVGGRFRNPNLFGEAKDLNIYGTIGEDVRGAGVSYLDRQFRDTDDSMEVGAFRDYARYHGYGQRIYGTYSEYGHPFSDYLSGFLRLRLEHVRLERRDDDLRESMDNYNVIALRPLLRRDLRNSRRWTTAGYMVEGGFETGYADGALLKGLHSFEWYKALEETEDWVYFYKHSVGLMPYEADEIGISERLFLGGTNSLRGFAPRGLGPKDEGEKDVATGGSTAIAQRHELRRRITRELSTRIFLDAGILEDDPLELGTPRAGTGAGFTVDIGPAQVDLDFAAPLLKEDEDRTRWFHFRLSGGF